MPTYDLEFHDYAKLFPLIVGEEYEALLNDIDMNGQRAPIIVYEGKILDGRNRYRVCAELLLTPKIEEFEGDDALGYVLSLNLYRRQLTVAQRALIAAELSSLRGSKAITVDLDNAQENDVEAARMAIEEAAKVLGISPRSVSSACKVVRDGTQELLDAVKSGSVSVSAAEQVAKLDKGAQQELCTRGPKAIRKAAKEMREDGRANSPKKAKPSEKAPTQVAEFTGADSDDDILKIGHLLSSEEEMEPEPVVYGSRKPAAQLMFELAESGMLEGLEAETVAAEIMDSVEAGIDMQMLAFAVEVAVKLRERLATRMHAH
ncbi:ParB/RepB/Spo0J family partition protein [Pseudomonas sp. 2FE]|uniref:ParB/RepB/Spo0J family partition protein n=1 Tax=Pseudomonas sp. 2FE TaxID=2502190 RepID=UPI0010F97A9C|nr:plasmid replication/partition related protein [Pseudomonas sp. 2FE]